MCWSRLILRRSRSFAAFVTRTLPSPSGKGSECVSRERPGPSENHSSAGARVLASSQTVVSYFSQDNIEAANFFSSSTPIFAIEVHK